MSEFEYEVRRAYIGEMFWGCPSLRKVIQKAFIMAALPFLCCLQANISGQCCLVDVQWHQVDRLYDTERLLMETQSKGSILEVYPAILFDSCKMNWGQLDG